MFRAIYLSKGIDGDTVATIKDLEEAELPPVARGLVTVDIDYSTINYKDALAIAGKSSVVRKFPMVPGIDFCGTVVDSRHDEWHAGDKVILNGWGVGESHWGGLSQRARVNGDWLIRLPQKLSPFQAMAIGTAGYTAMLCVLSLENAGVTPDSGEILVTGATGGVGSFAISLLASYGYEVIASTGKASETDFLTSLGAKAVLERSSLSEPGKPLEKERWAGVVDTVGSHTLANACASTRYGGAVTACGLAQGMDLPLTVAPFILRGVQLLGVDSVRASRKLRIEAWSRLATTLSGTVIDSIAQTMSLGDALIAAPRMLSGTHKGRTVVDVNSSITNQFIT